MSTEKKHIRHGVGVVRPFLYGLPDLPEFVKQVFSATELERNTVPGGFHVEARIGDSVVVMAAMDPPYEAATRASIYVYVPDVDAAYKRAIEMGASSIGAPENKPYKERQCGIKDSFGNTWWIATYTG